MSRSYVGARVECLLALLLGQVGVLLGVVYSGQGSTDAQLLPQTIATHSIKFLREMHARMHTWNKATEGKQRSTLLLDDLSPVADTIGALFTFTQTSPFQHTKTQLLNVVTYISLSNVFL